MNRTILQRRRQRERWKRLAVEMGPHPSLPPRWRRSERRRRWEIRNWHRNMTIYVRDVIVPEWPASVVVGDIVEIEWTGAVYVQELRAAGQVDGGFLAGMLEKEEGDER